MTEVIKRLSAAEREQMSAQARHIAEAPAAQVDARSGEKFVFVAHFDGTNNDKDNVKLSGNPHQTNVADLHDQMAPHMRGNDSFRSAYYRGVGTDAGAKGYHDVLLPSEEMRNTADRAYREFRTEALVWLEKNPQADPATSLQVMATGFSRGGGTAAVFSQLLYEHGLTDPKTGKQLVPPGQLGLAGAMVYDPVTTGYDGNAAFSPASKNVTVVRAQHEYREWFKGVDHGAHPGVRTVEVMGNHCNIGGGYDRGISARVLEASTEWFRQSGVPLADVPPHRRHDGAAAIYHEHDLPKTDEAMQASRSAIARAMWPLGSRAAEGVAQAADYPVTHDPRRGLNAPRQLDPAARPEAHVHDGWHRFEGAEGTVWRKHYALPSGKDATAVMIERDFPGRDRDRIDLHLLHTDEQGRTRELIHRQAPIGQGNDLRHQLDASIPGQNRAFQPNPMHESGARQFREQLGSHLRQLGMSEQQVDTLAAAAVKEQVRHAGQGGDVQAFYLSKDGSTIAMQQHNGPLREFNVTQALGQSEQAHWREAAELELASAAKERQPYQPYQPGIGHSYAMQPSEPSHGGRTMA